MSEANNILNYSAPRYPQSTPLGMWQDAGLVAVVRGTRMPSRCCVCNEPLMRDPKPKTMRWTAREDRRIGGRLLGSLISDSYSHGIVTRIGRCNKHRWHFKPLLTGIILILCGIGAGPTILVLSNNRASDDLIATISCILVFAGIIAILIPPRIRIVHFASNCAWFRGFGKAYIESLPPADVEPERQATTDHATQDRPT